MTYRTLVTIGQLAEQRHGLITAEWLNKAGLSPSQKTSLVTSGYLNRVTRGVYRVAGVPAFESMDILAYWMRLGDNDYSGTPTLVAAGATAAHLHGIGDMWPDPYEFITSCPRRTRDPNVILRHEPIDSADVKTVEGVPCLSPIATLVDLVKAHGDLSLVGDAVRDARWKRYLNEYTEPEFVRRLGALAGANGLPDGDGQQLFDMITQGLPEVRD